MIYKKSSLGLLIISLILGYFYIQPKIAKYNEKKQNSKIIANCELATDYFIKQYKLNSKVDGNKVLDEIILNFNTNSENPVNKHNQAFTKEALEGACFLEYDKTINTATFSGYSYDKSLIIRFVIKPPSFVRYDRD